MSIEDLKKVWKDLDNVGKNYEKLGVTEVYSRIIEGEDNVETSIIGKPLECIGCIACMISNLSDISKIPFKDLIDIIVSTKNLFGIGE